MADHLAALGLSEGATEQELRARWRELLRTHHPDAGGTVAAFIELRENYNSALDQIHNRKCPVCGGTGYRVTGAGGLQLKIRCGGCNA